MKHLPDPGIPIPAPKPKMSVDPFQLDLVMDLFEFVSKFSNEGIFSPVAKSFEAVGQPSGYLLYTTPIDQKARDPTKLRLPGLRDRAFVYVDDVRSTTYFHLLPLTFTYLHNLTCSIELD